MLATVCFDWRKDNPVGNKDQTDMMKADLWDPLHAFVDLLKNTEYRDTQTSLFNHTNTFIPNHGDVYSTALLLSGINPSKRGRNERSALPFIVRNT